MPPLVSCILPTKNRRRFLPQALRCFANRTYPNAELLIVDDSPRSAAPLCINVPGVRYLRLTQPTHLGTKMNLAIEAAKGDIIQRLDDDDYYGPEFIGASVDALPARHRSSTLVTRCCFLVLLPGHTTLFHSGHGWNPGGAFCFHRAFWKKHPYPDVDKSEDSILVRQVQPRIVRICRAGQYIVVRHGANTWNWVSAKPKAITAEQYFSREQVYPQPLESLVPAPAAAFYRRLLRLR